MVSTTSFSELSYCIMMPRWNSGMLARVRSGSECSTNSFLSKVQTERDKTTSKRPITASRMRYNLG